MWPLQKKGVFETGKVLFLPVDAIQPNPYQPRRIFTQPELEELSQSIQELGVLQPLTVRRRNGQWELVAGERRLRAAKLAGLDAVPCLSIHTDSQSSSLLALVENLQRRDLDFWEEALALRRLIDAYHISQEEVARRIGKSQSAVANKLRLLKLPQEVLELLRGHGASERHARALLRLPNAAMQLQIAQRIASEGLNVRATDTLVERILQELMPLEEADEPASGRVRRAYGDWRLLNNAIKTSVNQMVTAGLPVQYFLRDAGDNMEILVLVPKNAHRAQQPLSVVQGGGATSSV